jgi:hypothetical protein
MSVDEDPNFSHWVLFLFLGLRFVRLTCKKIEPSVTARVTTKTVFFFVFFPLEVGENEKKMEETIHKSH